MNSILQKGNFVQQRYRIHRLLGKGGFGSVYYAYDTERGHPVALKISHTSLQEEALLLLKLSGNTHVPTCYTSGWDEEGGFFYLSMQYIRGQTLANILHQTTPDIDMMEIIQQIITIMADLHNAGIIFRDLKPANMMITPTGWVYLIDFGLAIASDAVNEYPMDKRYAGTSYYLSPEVRTRGMITPAMDVFAFGKIIQQLLSTAEFNGSYPLHLLKNACCQDSMEKRPSSANDVRDLFHLYTTTAHPFMQILYTSVVWLKEILHRK